MLHVHSKAVRERVNADSEFRLAARHWNCRLLFEMERARFLLVVNNGEVSEFGPAAEAASFDIRITAAEKDWKELLAAVPRPWYHDIFTAGSRSGGFTVEGDLVSHLYPFYRAARRVIVVLRELVSGPLAAERTVCDVDRQFDTAVGRYAYLRIDGVQYRVYYEEAGRGIPLLLQHMAGADGQQWRHLLEDPYLQQRFRMIAVDLPYHGKSLPPIGIRWWEQEYRLTRAFLMDTLIGLSHALDLDRPVYMGCAIGGHLAPDLAFYHPERFRAVIGINAGLVTPLPHDDVMSESFCHPKINGDWKAAFMFSQMSPQSPEPYCRETCWIFSQSAPPVIKGDMFYYSVDHNLTGLASGIDTSKVDVYLLTGEYDLLSNDAGTLELARQIPGAKFQILPGMGHFGFSENPGGFRQFLVPVLDEIHAKHG